MSRNFKESDSKVGSEKSPRELLAAEWKTPSPVCIFTSVSCYE